MERKDFLEKLGVGLALICTGCGIASCGSTPKSEDPQPGNGNGDGGTPGNSLFTANLDTEIREIGTFKIAGGVILVRLAQGNAAGAFTAVQLACTHQGVSVTYNNAQRKFLCPAHGSEFDRTGAVLKGPAATALKEYNVSVNGSLLTVSA
jgi:cytochrome b6-f complex iron-sulfur subunit